MERTCARVEAWCLLCTQAFRSPPDLYQQFRSCLLDILGSSLAAAPPQQAKCMLDAISQQTHPDTADASSWLSFAGTIVSQVGSSPWTEPEYRSQLLANQSSLATADDSDISSVLLGFTVAVLSSWSQYPQLPLPDALEERSGARLRLAAGLLSRAADLQVRSHVMPDPAWYVCHRPQPHSQHVHAQPCMHHDVPHACDGQHHRGTQHASRPTAKQGLGALKCLACRLLCWPRQPSGWWRKP